MGLFLLSIPKHLLNNAVRIENMINKIKKPGITNVSAKVVNGQLEVRLNARVMGMKPRVRFTGPVSWDKEKKVLTIKVKKLDLPIALNSKMVFRMVIKSLVEGELVEVNKDTVIKVFL